MAATIVIIQTAPDFAQWKKVFDEHVDLRVNGGCLRSVVYRDPANPTRIVVMNHMKDLATARKYVHSLELIDAMFSAGVAAAPQIMLLEQADEQTYERPLPAPG
jgi:quinol monooxygenase YgiN